MGAGFTSTGTVPATYSLVGNQTFGFDFNPKTLQADGSIRIRLVGNNGVDLRLNSDTGQIAAVDGTISYSPTTAASVDAIAYNSNIAATSGTTTLYDIDFRNNVLAIQNPPNNGTLTQVGSLGLTVSALSGSGFDIYTDPALYPDPNLTDHIVCVNVFTLMINPEVNITSLNTQQVIDIGRCAQTQGGCRYSGEIGSGASGEPEHPLPMAHRRRATGRG